MKPSPRPHPRVLVRQACDAFGEAEVARACADLMVERAGGGSSLSVEWLGGSVAEQHRYWHRTWGARGLLYAWDPGVSGDVVSALTDEHWRVREMAAKVARAHGITEAADAVAGALTDPVERVRTAALRALAEIGDDEHIRQVATAQDDPAPEVRRRAEVTLQRITDRSG